MSRPAGSRASDADLARRLEQIELLFDLHSAGMSPKAVTVITDRLRRVRQQLERGAQHEAALRAKLVEMRKG